MNFLHKRCRYKRELRQGFSPPLDWGPTTFFSAQPIVLSSKTIHPHPDQNRVCSSLSKEKQAAWFRWQDWTLDMAMEPILGKTMPTWLQERTANSTLCTLAVIPTVPHVNCQGEIHSTSARCRCTWRQWRGGAVQLEFCQIKFRTAHFACTTYCMLMMNMLMCVLAWIEWHIQYIYIYINQQRPAALDFWLPGVRAWIVGFRAEVLHGKTGFIDWLLYVSIECEYAAYLSLIRICICDCTLLLLVCM